MTRTAILNTRVREARYKVMQELDAIENRIYELRLELSKVDSTSIFYKDLKNIEKLANRYRRRYLKLYENNEERVN